MSTKKTIGGAFGAIVVLLVAQILAQLLASVFVLVKVPEGICNIAAGILYVGLAYVLLKLFSKKLLKIPMDHLGMPKFFIKTKWMIAGILLPLTVKPFIYCFFRESMFLRE